jgi:hypothetical protein
MKRIYQFYDKEEIDARERVFEFPPPFHQNMNEDLIGRWGSFLKLVDHQNRIVRIHSSYDSGKGCTIIDPLPRKKPRKPTRILLQEVLKKNPQVVRFCGLETIFVFNFSRQFVYGYKDAYIDFERGQVAGYFMGRFPIEPHTVHEKLLEKVDADKQQITDVEGHILRIEP